MRDFVKNASFDILPRITLIPFMPYSKLTQEEAQYFLYVIRWRTGDKWEEYMSTGTLTSDDSNVNSVLVELTNEILSPIKISPSFEVSEEDQVAVDENIREFTSSSRNKDEVFDDKGLKSDLAEIPNMNSISKFNQ
jgi:hypothetical protein